MWSSIPGKGKRFLSSPKYQAFSAAHEVNRPVDTKAMTQGVMWLGQEPDLSPPSTANVKKKKCLELRYIHTLPIHFHGTVFN
jgi:hypothetical protein